MHIASDRIVPSSFPPEQTQMHELAQFGRKVSPSPSGSADLDSGSREIKRPDHRDRASASRIRAFNS